MMDHKEFDIDPKDCDHPKAEFQEEEAPTCHYPGVEEGWYCPDCGKFWQDDEATKLGI